MIGAVVSAGSSYASQAIKNKSFTKGINWRKVAGSAAEGAITGAVGAAIGGTSLAASAAGTAAKTGAKAAAGVGAGVDIVAKKKVANAASEFIKYGELDSLGRATGISAVVTKDMIGTGTKANHSIIPAGFKGGGVGSPGHARGHLLGKQLGGSGDDPRNLVTLFQNPVNSPIMRDYENAIRKTVERGMLLTTKLLQTIMVMS